MTLKEFKKLINLKSIITLIMTVALVLLLFLPTEPPKEILALFCTSYGAVITYFFTRRENKEKEDSSNG